MIKLKDLLVTNNWSYLPTVKNQPPPEKELTDEEQGDAASVIL